MMQQGFHQNPYHSQDWSHHQQRSQHNDHRYTQSQSTAAALQQQHFGRINGSAAQTLNHGAGNGGTTRDGVDGNAVGPNEPISEDNRRVLGWIADVLNASTREGALLELSKKREQVPELALILWHSFGRSIELLPTGHLLIPHRGHDIAVTRDNFGLPSAEPFSAHSCSVESCLQCPRPLTMCCITLRDPRPFPWR